MSWIIMGAAIFDELSKMFYIYPIGIILQVNAANFDTEVLQSDGIVLVDFYADWCGPCKMLAPELESLAGDLADNPAVKDQELARQYQVQSIPNVVVFYRGKQVDWLIGLRPKDDYKSCHRNTISRVKISECRWLNL